MSEAGRIREIYERIEQAAQHWPTTTLDHFHGEPFKALITSMLSAQTREEQTLAAARALFQLADTPAAMLKLSDAQIIQAVRPVTYFQNKAVYVREICERLVSVYGGEVPAALDDLITFRGVGWKVAVLTRQIGFGIHDDITVDVHVNRISKRLGLVSPAVKQPAQINEALKAVLPRAYWPRWNSYMVQFGREVCKPTYPQCATCLVRHLCPRIGVIETGPGRYKNEEYD